VLYLLQNKRTTSVQNLNTLFRVCFYYLKNIRKIRPYLTAAAAKTVVHSIISSRLDYCNSLLIGISDYLIKKLQRVQNCAARIILNLKKYDSITPALIKLHWLPVKNRIIYKINVIVFKALNGDTPGYISDMIELHKPVRALRSSNKKYMLKEKKSNLKTMGDRSFTNAAPKIWNSLPDDIRNIDLKLHDFKTKLKTHLFNISFENIRDAH